MSNRPLDAKVEISKTEEYESQIKSDSEDSVKLDSINYSDSSLDFHPKRKLENKINNKNGKINRKYEKKISDLLNQIELLNHELKMTEKEKNSLKEEIEFINFENEKIINIKNSEIERIKEELNDLKYKIEKEKNRKKNEKEYEKKEDDRYNNDKLKKLNEKNDNLDIINSNLNEALTKLQKENYIINEKYLELRGNIEGLKIDKSGLAKKVTFYENRMKEQEERINNLEKELKEMKLINRNYEQIIADKDLNLNYSKLNNNSFLANNKLSEEINEMKIKYEKDISKIKKDYNKILEDKTNDFIIEINEYKNKIEDYELRLKNNENAVSLYKSHIDEQNKRTNDEINLLKIEVNDKAKEISSKNALYQEQIAAAILHKNEAEKLKEKNESLRKEILLTKSNCMKQIEEEKEKNSKLFEKVMRYEEIEGNLAKLLNEKKNEIIDKNNEKYFENLGKKKYNQCLSLINTIKIMKVEIEKLKIQNEELNNNLKIVNDQCNVYKSISDKMEKPYSYLVKNLQDKDIESLKLNRIISNKDQTINKLKQQCEIYENTINTMKKELSTIINNRQQINNLENLLMNYINNENEGKNNNTDMNRINYFLNNFNKSISFDNKNFQTSNNFNNNKNLDSSSQFNNNYMTFPQNFGGNNFNKDSMAKTFNDNKFNK